MFCLFSLLLFSPLVSGAVEEENDIRTVNFRMPGIAPRMDDAYYCTSQEVPEGKLYITNFQALAAGNIAHHILLFGCQAPASNRAEAWQCANPCERGTQSSILFAWAKNAPPTHVPSDVGFQIGDGTHIRYLVMQIHYKDAFAPNAPEDHSGLELTVTQTKQKYLAGIFLFAENYGAIPANKPNYHIDLSCKYTGQAELHPFAFRVHSHTLGRVISAYHYNSSWHLVGKGNPQWPQAFYPTQNTIIVKPGDVMAARCTYDSTSKHALTRIGASHVDEMCNFYMMYYMDSSLGRSYYSCEDQLDSLPPLPQDSDAELPRNPLLEDIASGHQHKGIMDWPTTDSEYNERRQSYTPRKSIAFPPQRSYADYPSNPYDYSDFSDEMEKPNVDKNYFYEVLNQRSRNRHPSPASDHYYYDQTPYDDQRDRHRSQSQSRSRLQKTTTPKPVHKVKAKVKQEPGGGSLRTATSGIELDSNWPSVPLALGQVSGIATDSTGHLHLFHRPDREWDANSFDKHNVFQQKSQGPIKKNTILVLDSAGRVRSEWGNDMFYMPHGLHIDYSDNLWITDVALHQVMKFPKNSRKASLVLGVAFKPGSDHKHFCKPADVAVTKHGDFFIADGYCNSRILHYGKNGDFIKEWGEASRSVLADHFPPPSTFDVVHSITLLESTQEICAADRDNGRLQCFSYEGEFFRQLHPSSITGSYFAVQFSQRNNVLYMVNGANAYQNTECHGFTLDPQTGKVIEQWAPQKGFSQPHDVTVDPSGKYVYVSEIGPNRVWKFAVTDNAIEGYHHSVKKGSAIHPVASIDAGKTSEELEAIEKETENEGSFGASLMIGALLIVPVVMVASITLFLRMRRKGAFNKLLGDKSYKNNRRLNLGNLLSRNKGFNRLQTDGSDPELDHLNSDSEVEEFSATSEQKA